MNAQFKKWQRKWILVGIRKLRKQERNILGIKDTDPHYSSLSPLGNASEQEHYKKALDWALKNRAHKDIKNIALTGPYGSGKSTILKTYKNNCEDKDLEFLFISLATFKEEELPKATITEENKTPNSNGEEKPGQNNENKTAATEASLEEKQKGEADEKTQLLRLIETSILQQIFYHENDDKIPDSRFKKIRSFSFRQLIGYTIMYSFFLLSLYSYFKPKFLQTVFKHWTMDERTLNWIHYCTIIIITVGVVGIIFSSIRIIRSVTLQKLNFQNAEIGIGANQNKSILNHHIDEILYFFSVRPYNVVVIEDLDRFKQTEIFTKLREINLLLNNSKKTAHKDIVFIYAVRDEMFDDQERTKFFDFIIPVIPIINSSNSAKKLMAKRSEFNLEISDEVIENVSYYINDMRLLHNICNEYYLYRNSLDANIKYDKLFAIITYKNIQPKQFVLLSKNSGTIFDMIHSKDTEIKSLVLGVDAEIAAVKKEMERLDDLYIRNVKDLRLIYLAKLLPQLNNFKDFKFESALITLDQMTHEDNFAHLENDRLEYEHRVAYYNQYRVETANMSIKFADLERLVDPERSYQTRVDEIDGLNADRKKILSNKTQELEKEKEKMRNLPVAEILQKTPVHLEPGKEMKLEDVLVRNGYISEDYPDYISLFHEGDISRTDYQFMLKLKNGVQQEKDYKLHKVARVVAKINPLSFNSHLVLNFDILDFLLKDPEANAEKLKRILEVLKDESEISSAFITAYLERTPHLGAFISRLSKAWPNIWRFFEDLLEEKKEKELFTWLITYLDNPDIAALSRHYDLTKMIAHDAEFPNIIADQEKVRDLIKTLNIKFQKLDADQIDHETLDFIYKNDHYGLIPTMLTAMIKKFGSYDHHKFNHSNYFAIKKSGAEHLIKYIDSNLDTYITTTYLLLELNTRDDESTILQLLNHADIKLENRKKIIARMDSKISNLSKVQDNEIIAELFIQHKVVPTWANILIDFSDHEQEISGEVIDFLNSGENTKELTITKIPSEGESRDGYIQLARKLAQTTTFHNEVYEEIAKAMSFWFDDLDLSQNSYEQVETLVERRVILPSKKSFEYLKEEGSPLHIKLFEMEQSDLIKILQELTLDRNDIELLLKSGDISITNKNKILEHVDEDMVTSNAESIRQVIHLLNAHPQFTVSDTLLDVVLLFMASPTEERIKALLNRKSADRTFLDSFIPTLTGNYPKITDQTTRPTFAKNGMNERFLSLVKDAQYISSFSEHRGDYKIYRKGK